MNESQTLSSWRLLALYWFTGPLVSVILGAIVIGASWPPAPRPDEFMTGGILFGLFFLVVLYVVWLPLMKIVRLDKDRLIIRGIFRSESVQLTNVRNVFQNFWFPVKGVRPVVIHFETPTRFGSHVLFIPKWDSNTIPTGWRRKQRVENRVVQELRDKIEKARARIDL